MEHYFWIVSTSALGVPLPVLSMQGWTRMKIRRQEFGVGHPVTHALLVQEVELLTHLCYLLFCYCQSNRYVSEGGF